MGLGGSCGGYFLHTLFTFALGPEKGFGISLSLTPMALRRWDVLHGHAHVNNKHSLRTSFVPCRPTVLYMSPNSVLESIVTPMLTNFCEIHTLVSSHSKSF